MREVQERQKSHSGPAVVGASVPSASDLALHYNCRCWQPDRTVAVAGHKTEESPNSAEQCAG